MGTEGMFSSWHTDIFQCLFTLFKSRLFIINMSEISHFNFDSTSFYLYVKHVSFVTFGGFDSLDVIMVLQRNDDSCEIRGNSRDHLQV